MRFADPRMLQVLILIPVMLFLYVLYIQRRKRVRSVIGDPDLVEKMWSSVNHRYQHLRVLLLCLSCTFLVLALARPQWGAKLEQVKRKGLDIMFVLDLSKSMSAQDVQPSRLERAKMEIVAFLDNLKGDRVGICGFAGQALMICPLTLDYSAVKLFLNMLNTRYIPVPGTKIGDAIELARGALSAKAPGEQRHAVCVLITDGEDLGSDWQAAAQGAAAAGVRIYTVGMGMPEGEPIPERDDNGNITGYKKDKDGKVVMSRLNEQSLGGIAMVTGGGYSRGDLSKVYKAISKLERREFAEKYETQYQDKFQWLLLPALMCLIGRFLISDRKKRV
jgi:Ca-activated chloride channel family protein